MPILLTLFFLNTIFFPWGEMCGETLGRNEIEFSQARERLEKLSALRKIKPVDMSALSQQVGNIQYRHSYIECILLLIQRIFPYRIPLGGKESCTIENFQLSEYF